MSAISTARLFILALLLALAGRAAADATVPPAGAGAGVAALLATLDELLARELPGGGWTFAHPNGPRPAPLTAPLRLAERVAVPLGMADWKLVVLRSPGTSTAGLALLTGYRLTGRDEYLAAARRAGDVLVAAQLPSGGWFSEMPMSDGKPAGWFAAFVRRTTFDDDVTPGAIRFLLALWQAVGDERYRDAAVRGIDLLLHAQLGNGAWPLLWRPGWKLRLWPTYEDLPTLNDGATTQPITTMLMAARMLGRADLLAAARRAGDWLISAQLPEPHPIWAQQYALDGRPAPARRFERAAIASWESRLAIDALLELAAATGDERYCAPIPRAVAWLKKAAIGPRCWSRLYALRTDQPLYFDERGRRVSSPAEAHQPYDWTGEFGIAALLRRLHGDAPEAIPASSTNGHVRAARALAVARRVPGDPGPCGTIPDLTVDARAVRDGRALIGRAGLLVSALEPPPRSICQLHHPRNMNTAAATRQPAAAR